MDRPIIVPPWIKASEGRAFQLGSTSIYVGPREPTSGGRNLKRPPVLAYSRPGDAEPHIVCEFPNSSAAEQFITALTIGIDEARGAVLSVPKPEPENPVEPLDPERSTA